MGDNNWSGNNSLIDELLQGKEVARHLQLCLNTPSSTSQETRELLVNKIIASFEKALAILNWNINTNANININASNSSMRVCEPPISKHVTPTPTRDSPPFSPRSEDSDKDLRDQDHNPSKNIRKPPERWTKQIKVSPGVGVEALLDDGFSWRKYGQKDILGAKFPRGYYRCTHRNVQGCLATKQVQRSDEDPTIFEITYRGNHTCTLASSKSTTLQSDPNQSHQQLVNLREGLRLLTDNLDASDQTSFASFHFPNSNIINETTNVRNETNVAAENFGFGFVGHQNLPASASPAATASSNNTTAALEFSFDHQFQIDGHNFTFDNNSRFF